MRDLKFLIFNVCDSFFSKYFYNILSFIVVHESPISHFKGFSIEGTHCNNSMWERFLIAAQGLLRGQRQDSSQCPLGSYDKKEGFLCDSFEISYL